MLRVLLNADVCNVRLRELAARIGLGEAGVDDAPLLILESFRPRHLRAGEGGLQGRVRVRLRLRLGGILQWCA